VGKPGESVESKESVNTATPYIPPRTRAELMSPAPRGYRHEQIKSVVLPLLAAGLTAEAVFVQLRGMYASDMSDREIHDLIAWAVSKNPQRCERNWQNHRILNYRQSIIPDRVTPEHAIANTQKWLGNFRCDEADLWHTSPWRPLEEWRLDPLMLFAALYDKEEYINVVTDFTIEQKDGEPKANPRGAGETLARDEWMSRVRDYGTPQSEAGVWVRPNPVKSRGSGKHGAVTDADVTSYRFCLLESDALPTDLQLSLWARLPLPVAAIVTSGGRSVHAWVMLNYPDVQEFRAKVDQIHALLSRLGICPSNKNPSRLSRLPGAHREIGKHGDGNQQLLYCNPEPLEAPIFERSNR
jgi:hypothetical protein